MSYCPSCKSKLTPDDINTGVCPACEANLTDTAITGDSAETLYLGTTAALMLPAGRLGDAADKCSLFVGGMLAFTAATVLYIVITAVVMTAMRIVEKRTVVPGMISLEAK